MTQNIGSIGIDLGGTSVRAGLVMAGKVIKSTSARIAGLTTEEEVWAKIFACIDELVASAAQMAADASQESNGAAVLISGIGIGVPSIVDAKRGIVYDTVNIPSWKEVPCKEILEARYGIAAWVNNDANCFALGEKYYGAGKYINTLAGVTIGTGLGTGIVIEGRLFNGAHCGAGEMGYIGYKDVHFEHYASGQYFMATYQRSGEDLLAAARSGDPASREAFHQFGIHVGHALLAIVYAYDPEMIVLGGSVTQAYSFFEPGMRDSLNGSVFPHAMKDLQIVCSTTGDVAILGASLLSKDKQYF